MRKEKLDETTKIVLEKVKKIDKRYAKTIAVMGITIIVFAILYSLFMRKNVVIQPLLFVTENNELKYATVDSQTPKLITTIDQLKNVSFSNTSNKRLVYTLQNASFLLDVLNNKSIPFGKELEEVLFSLNDKYIVARAKNGSLTLYDFDIHKELDQGVTKIICVTENGVLYQKGTELYRRIFTEKESYRLAQNVDDISYQKDVQKALYRVKKTEDSFDYYVLSLKNYRTELALEGVTTLYSYNSDFTKFLYSVRNQSNAYTKTDFLNDSYAIKDDSFVAFSVDDILQGKVTYSEYLENQKEKEAITKRNVYRKAIEDYISTLQESTLYYKINNQIQEITNRAVDVAFTNVDAAVVVYQSYNFDKQLNIEEITKEEDIQTFLKEVKIDYIYTKNALHNKTLLSLYEGNVEFYMTKNQDLYYNFQGDLYYLPFKGDEVLDEVLIDKNIVFDANIKEYDKFLLYYTVDTKELKAVITNQKKTLDQNVTKIFHIDEKRKILLYQTSEKDTSYLGGDLKMYYNQKSIFIEKDVVSINYVNRNLIYITKKSNQNNASFDLYRYVGTKELEKINSNVNQVWSMNSLANK